MEDRKPRIAITQGDTNGIGYETIFKAFSEPEMLDLCTPVIYGSPKIAAYHNKALNFNNNFCIINKAEDTRNGNLNVLTCFENEVKVELGTPTEESGLAAMKALDRAMTDFRNGLFDALVMAPISKDSLKINGIPFNSVSDFVKMCVNEKSTPLTIYINERMRVTSLTDNCAFKDVSQAINKDDIISKSKEFFSVLKRDFRLSEPRIAVLALNPDGKGTEEKEIIAPAVNALADEGLPVFGPYTADEFFASNSLDSFDGVLSMYHDQGLLPFHILQPDNGICMIAGLPLICTYPDMTPQFNIAGKGIANENQLRSAVYAAIDIARNRENYDAPLANPLQKIYKDKRDENDKQHFSGQRTKERSQETND
jgi:4-hydroxythreonine-4-phosphate dehydrogenase